MDGTGLCKSTNYPNVGLMFIIETDTHPSLQVIRGWNPSDIEPINGTIHPCEYCQYINDTRQGFDDQDEVMEQIMSSLQYEIDGFTLPVSQYGPSPVWNDTSLALMDLWTHAVFKKEVVASLEYDVPVISETLDLDFLLQFITTQRESHSRDRNILRSFTLDQVKDNFGEDAQTIGYVIGIVPWSTFFQNLLPENVNGIVVIVESDCGSEFTYIVNGGQDDWCAIGDHHDPKYESMKQEYEFFWKEHPKGTSRHCHFDLAIYPSNDFHKQYESNEPVLYAGLVGLAFLFVAVVFALYDVFIYQRQKRVLMDAQNLVIENATNSARKERELNDFIAHEVRNPLAAAISACSFVSSAISEESLLVPGGMGANPLIGNNAKRKSVEEDINIIESSLHFINDLLRNMLDMQRASTNQLNIEMQPTHLLNDVLKPVDSMLHRRGTSFQVYVECCSEEGETDIVILADKLRLKQIMLNLARNSVKFVEKGFILLAAKVVVNSTTCKKTVQLSVEDSGPGIPEEKRKQLFQKFQDSLDSLHQGTGIGLSLCKLLTDLMGGEIYIDDTYDSGISGQPGTRFVVDLNISPIKWDDDALDKYSSDIAPIENNRNDITKHNIYNSSCSFGNGYGNNITSSLKDVDGRLSNETLHKRHLESPSANKDNDGAEGAAKKPQKKPLPSELVVLFVDDDMVLRKLFCRAVKKIAPDWTLMEASSGETALTMASEYDFDIIFMDQYMASVQKQLLGTEATRALRAQGETANICGLSANDVEEAFFEAGADSFMMKPFPCKPELLKEELLRVLNNQRTI